MENNNIENLQLAANSNLYVGILNKYLSSSDKNVKLIPFRYKDKWGYSDRNKQIKIKCEYDWVGRFDDNGLGPFGLNGKYGLLNKEGTVISRRLYDDLLEVANGMRRFELEGLYGYVNSKGLEVCPCIYTKAKMYFNKAKVAWAFRDNLFIWLNDEGVEIFSTESDDAMFTRNTDLDGWGSHTDGWASATWYPLDTTGNRLAPIFEDYLSDQLVRLQDPYSYGQLIPVTQGGKIGFIDKNGHLKIPMTYIRAELVGDGKWRAVTKKDEWLINEEGKITRVDEKERLTNGFFKFKVGEKYGLRNEVGKLVANPIFDSIQLGNDRLFPVEVDHLWGCVDSSGRICVPIEYESVRIVSNPDIVIVKKNGKYGCVGINGNLIVPSVYEWVYEINSVIFLKLEGMVGFCDLTGRVLVECIYGPYSLDEEEEYVDYPFESEGMLTLRKYNKYGAYNVNGDLIIPFIYNNAFQFSDDGIAWVNYNDRGGYIDKKGIQFWID